MCLAHRLVGSLFPSSHVCIWCACMCARAHDCEHRCTCLWRPEAGEGNHPWLLFHLIHCDRVSQSNPELPRRIPCPLSFWGGVKGRWPSLSYFGSGDCNSVPHYCPLPLGHHPGQSKGFSSLSSSLGHQVAQSQCHMYIFSCPPPCPIFPRLFWFGAAFIRLLTWRFLVISWILSYCQQLPQPQASFHWLCAERVGDVFGSFLPLSSLLSLCLYLLSAWLFTWVLGSELRSFCLYSKPFTNWAVSPAWLLPLKDVSPQIREYTSVAPALQRREDGCAFETSPGYSPAQKISKKKEKQINK